MHEARTYCHYFQLGSHDEQEAVVRKELQRRKEVLDKVCVLVSDLCTPLSPNLTLIYKHRRSIKHEETI